MTEFPDYHKMYYDIIEMAQDENRHKGETYYESHHIFPKSIGGSDEDYNLVLLTPQEHLKAHLLLPELLRGDDRDKMITAAIMMAGHVDREVEKGFFDSFDKMKEEHSIIVSKRFAGKVRCKDETGKSLLVSKEEFDSSDHLVGITKGRSFPQTETKSKNIKKALKAYFSHNKQWSYGKKGKGISMWGKNHKEDSKKQIGDAISDSLYVNYGEEEKRVSTRNLIYYLIDGWSQGRLLRRCDYCDKKMDARNLKRWHQDNCKMKDTNGL